MSYRKILAALIIFGTVLMGIGSGVAFAEFSSFSYGGDIAELEEKCQKEYKVDITECINEEHNKIFYTCYFLDEIEVISDDTLNNDEMVVEITYNKMLTEPVIVNNNYHDYFDNGELIRAVNIEINYNENSNNSVNTMLKYKDAILKDMKNRTISNYNVELFEKVVIRVSEENVDKIERINW